MRSPAGLSIASCSAVNARNWDGFIAARSALERASMSAAPHPESAAVLSGLVEIARHVM